MTDDDKIAELERRVQALESKLTSAGITKLIREYERHNGPGSATGVGDVAGEIRKLRREVTSVTSDQAIKNAISRALGPGGISGA